MIVRNDVSNYAWNLIHQSEMGKILRFRLTDSPPPDYGWGVEMRARCWEVQP